MKLARQAKHLKKCINGAKDNDAAIIINPSRPIPPKVPQGHISNLMIISLSLSLSMLYTCPIQQELRRLKGVVIFVCPSAIIFPCVSVCVPLWAATTRHMLDFWRAFVTALDFPPSFFLLFLHSALFPSSYTSSWESQYIARIYNASVITALLITDGVYWFFFGAAAVVLSLRYYTITKRRINLQKITLSLVQRT